MAVPVAMVVPMAMPAFFLFSYRPPPPPLLSSSFFGEGGADGSDARGSGDGEIGDDVGGGGSDDSGGHRNPNDDHNR